MPKIHIKETTPFKCSFFPPKYRWVFGVPNTKKDSIVYEAISSKAGMIAESNLVKKVVARLFLSYLMDAPPPPHDLSKNSVLVV